LLVVVAAAHLLMLTLVPPALVAALVGIDAQLPERTPVEVHLLRLH